MSDKDIKNIDETTPEEYKDMSFENLDEIEKLHDIEKNKKVGFFDRESGFNKFMTKFGTYIWANILFILCCLPVVTIGASLTALNATMLQFHKHDDIKVASIFFNALKENFLQSTIGFIISTGIFSMGLVVLMAAFQTSDNIVALIAVGILAGLMMVGSLCFFTFYFVLLANFENDMLTQMKNALTIGLAYIRWSFVIWLIWILSIGIFFVEPILFIIFGFVWIMFGFSLLVYQTLKIHKHVFVLVNERYVTD